MSERDQILLILLATVFAGTSFWPVVMGWVDLGTVDGWLQLLAAFGLCVTVAIAFALFGAVGFFAASLGRWGCRLALRPRSEERRRAVGAMRLAARILYRLLNQAWKSGWRVGVMLRRRDAVGLDSGPLA